MQPADAGIHETRAPARVFFGALVALALAAYYWLYFLPPRLLGAADPDRHYHLGLSRLVAHEGLLRRLPQADDLGWGRYFPDKEFLFHALTGGAWAVGGDDGVLWLVPLIGIVLALLLYDEASRRLKPAAAAALVSLAILGTAGFVYRMTLLRPHVLAVLLFSLLVLAVLRRRSWAVGVAAAAFALAYHAFYLVLVVAAAAWLLRRQPGVQARAWAWSLGGLLVGVLANPYFPSNVEMGLFHMRLALGLETLPVLEQSPEVLNPTLGLLVFAYGFVYATVLFAGAVLWRQRRNPGVERSGLAFLALVTAALALLSFKSLRAMEYGVPCAILLAAFATSLSAWRYSLPSLLATLLLFQGAVDWDFYRTSWNPIRSGYPEYAAVLQQVPDRPGMKVFNCEWEAGAFILHARPDLKFVDLLEPAFLWHASPTRYQARRGLVEAAFDDPRAILRGAFKADYVLCGTRYPRFIRQMQSRPQDFRAGPGTETDPVRLFAVRPD